MKSLAPVLNLLRDFFADKAARLLRLHVSQLRPARDGRIAPAELHRRYALWLSKLEAPR